MGKLIEMSLIDAMNLSNDDENLETKLIVISDSTDEELKEAIKHFADKFNNGEKVSSQLSWLYTEAKQRWLKKNI